MIDVRRGAGRSRTVGAGVDSRHSFSFGAHYDPQNVSFGPLRALNEEVLQPGAGFDTHTHRDVDILTWVLRGALTHEDSTGRRAVMRPGTAQLLRAGSGVEHSEHNRGDEPVRYVQMWVEPDTPDLPPAYALAEVDPSPGAGWVSVASGAPGTAPLQLAQRCATFSVARLAPGEALGTPPHRLQHLFVTSGAVELVTPEHAGPATLLERSDAVRLSAPDATDATGAVLDATGPAEVLLWTLAAGPGPGISLRRWPP